MNLKVAHLVAAQCGFLIGIAFCLVVARFDSARSPSAAETRAPTTERAEAIEQMSEPDPAYVAADDAELEIAEALTEQPAPALPNEYSPEAVEKSMALITKLYYEQIAPRPRASAIPASNSAVPVAASYTEVVQEPEPVPAEEPAPHTVVYVKPAPVVVYPQPVQLVAFSQPRRVFNRCQPNGNPNALASNHHRRWNNGRIHVSGAPGFRPPRSVNADQRRTDGPPTCSSPKGFAARGKR